MFFLRNEFRGSRGREVGGGGRIFGSKSGFFSFFSLSRSLIFYFKEFRIFRYVGFFLFITLRGSFVFK